MKLRLAALLVALALVLPSAASTLAAEPLGEPLHRVRVYLYESRVEGWNWANATDLTATLLDGRGVPKATCTVQPADGWIGPSTPATGYWSCYWQAMGILASAAMAPPPTILPGDTVEVSQLAVTATSRPLADVRLTNVSLQRNTVSGIVAPSRRTAYARVSPAGTTFLAPPPDPFEAFGAIRPDRTFTLSFDARDRIHRRDTVEAGYAAGAFLVVRTAQVPGLSVEKDSNRLALAGLPNSRYRLELRSRDGSLKARATTFLLDSMGPRSNAAAAGPTADTAISRSMGGAVAFTTPSGRPVRIRRGDSIRVIGWGGFTYRIPGLGLELADRDLTVRTMPGREVLLTDWVIYPSGFGSMSSWVTVTDVSGQALIGLTPYSEPPGSESVTAQIFDRGNVLMTSRYLVP